MKPKGSIKVFLISHKLSLLPRSSYMIFSPSAKVRMRALCEKILMNFRITMTELSTKGYNLSRAESPRSVYIPETPAMFSP